MANYLPWVAVIDDEDAIRRALQRLMRSVGIEVKTYASGMAFIDESNAWGACQPYCVVLDLHMPMMSGFEVQSWLNTHAPNIGVIIITGHHTATEQSRALLAKPLAYLPKPMDDEALLAAIALASHRHPSTGDVDRTGRSSSQHNS